MAGLMEFRMQQHIAHEIYRQQMMQRIPDPYPSMLPVPPPMHAFAMQPRYPTLPDVEAKLQNKDLWKQFHKIGTEMIITKSGRRMFPSMRLSVDGLEADESYCVLLEMVPISDCRYKFSGSQWIPAGGAEPQSPQRMYLHPDSPALGSHWQSQPILFNKVKLTNNTLDNSGHIVLTSMHKYQPRIHIIRTSEPSHIPWAAQKCFIFPEGEFIAVTAYQNDKITKLKIDNNPFAKGFRETGQSRCKRKLSTTTQNRDEEEHETKRIRSNGSANSEIEQHNQDFLMRQYNQNMMQMMDSRWRSLVFPYLQHQQQSFYQQLALAGSPSEMTHETEEMDEPQASTSTSTMTVPNINSPGAKTPKNESPQKSENKDNKEGAPEETRSPTANSEDKKTNFSIAAILLL